MISMGDLALLSILIRNSEEPKLNTIHSLIGFMKKNTRLILALDVTSRKDALSLAKSLKDYFDAIKIGYPLILSAGLDIVHEISAIAPVIADLKIADIPNTSRLICEAALGAGAESIIAHAFTGRDSLQACADCAKKYNAELFVVAEMSHPGAEQFMAPLAAKLAELAVEVNAAGVVAPATRPDSTKLIRSIIGDRLIISPGVGAQGGSASAALAAGADFLIIGRSITKSNDPAASAKKVLSEIS